ncbi:DUF6054 family protein [Clostridium pasteurianum]|uniref:Uncharacterized protein n=1 Tax=Clostridium pasteurianum BC1 TaxID=86416 RepID=R4JZ49_CLOPA|nr:DUF6054 family protein [Clostridium pasteurianum]AGK96097.1 hypothetical protein Clopa_1096 [Clostridium pasteurianum BC1]
MNKKGLIVNILPDEVLSKIKNNIDADLIHEEFHEVQDKKYIGTLVFEKYFFRVKNRVALVVIADNFDDNTKVRVISTASSEGIFFNFDWGAGDSFMGEVENILSNNILSEYSN